MDKTDERKLVDQLALGVLVGEDFDLWYLPDGMVANMLEVAYIYVWRARREFNIMPKLLWAMAAKGYLDPSEVAAVLTVPVQPCGECGEAHTQKTCAYSRKRQDRGRTFAARLPDDLFDEITADARRRNMTNGEWLAGAWNYWSDDIRDDDDSFYCGSRKEAIMFLTVQNDPGNQSAIIDRMTDQAKSVALVRAMGDDSPVKILVTRTDKSYTYDLYAPGNMALAYHLMPWVNELMANGLDRPDDFDDIICAFNEFHLPADKWLRGWLDPIYLMVEDTKELAIKAGLIPD